MKTVYIKRLSLFDRFSLILCNNITEVDESFFEDNPEVFYSMDTEEDDDEPEMLEPYQFYLTNCDKRDVDYLNSWGVRLGYSEALDLYVLPIYDFGTGWGAFSYSKEVDDHYHLGKGESWERSTVY